MVGEKSNTAECDKKGRCTKHPAIQLRKRKLFGGWKIIIGHCPECCLDEMRRVRDEISAEAGDDSVNINSRTSRSSRRNKDGTHRSKKKKKKKKKKHSERDRSRDGSRRSSHHHLQRENSLPERDIAASEGHVPISGPVHQNNMMNSSPNNPQVGQIGDQTSNSTASTAQNSSMDGNSSVQSGTFMPQVGHHDRSGLQPYHQSNNNSSIQQQQHSCGPQSPDDYASAQQQQQPPPPIVQRAMVLSMAFTDPQTGQRGTYTGQVNSINHKPDGKGTVYYANGNIAEGTWSGGILLDDETASDSTGSRSQHSSNHQNSQTQRRGHRSQSPAIGHGGGGGGGGGNRGQHNNSSNRDRSTSRDRSKKKNRDRSSSRESSTRSSRKNLSSRGGGQHVDAPQGQMSTPPGQMSTSPPPPPPPPPRRHNIMMSDNNLDYSGISTSSRGGGRRMMMSDNDFNYSGMSPPSQRGGSQMMMSDNNLGRSPSGGNLDRLSELGGKKKRLPRGASASVGELPSHLPSHRMMSSSSSSGQFASSSASVQLDHGGQRSPGSSSFDHNYQIGSPPQINPYARASSSASVGGGGGYGDGYRRTVSGSTSTGHYSRGSISDLLQQKQQQQQQRHQLEPPSSNLDNNLGRSGSYRE